MTAAVEKPGLIEYGVPLSSLLRADTIGGKLAVPVTDYTLYAQFKHFTTVPAGPEGYGYSISRLRALDILLDRLTQLGGSTGSTVATSIQGALAGAAHSDVSTDAAELAPGAIDQLISHFGNKVRAILDRADTLQFNIPAKAVAAPGAVMNLTA